MVTWAYLPLSTLPAPYDIIWCRFPEHESLGQPGPKPRPALVRNVGIDVAHGYGEVEVAYGTTRLKTASRLYDFVVSKPAEMDQCGLFRATRFDLDNVLWIPWAAEWTSSPPGTESPILGHLSDHAIKMLEITLAYKNRN